MDNEVKILTLPVTNYTDYIQMVQSSLGFSPTRILDDKKIPLESPQAFLCTLENLADGTYPRLWEHFSVSFIIKCDYETVIFSMEQTLLSIFTREIDRLKNLSIFTGNLTQWKDAVLIGCAQSVPHDVRLTFNKVFLHFNQLNINLWPNVRRRKLKDETLIIET